MLAYIEIRNHCTLMEVILNHKSVFPRLYLKTFIIGESKCVAHGINSISALGAELSGNQCRVVHQIITELIPHN